MSGFFKGDSGKYSMMRLLCFITLIASLPMFYLHPEQSSHIAVLCGAALAGKWLQRKGE